MNKVVRICYLGDSITLGLGHDEKMIRIRDRWTNNVERRLVEQFKGIGIFFHTNNQGVNGDTTRLGLERFKYVQSFKPDILVMQFGINDSNYWLSDNGLPRVIPAAFKWNLIELIAKAYASGVKKVILSTNYLIPIEKRLIIGVDFNTTIAYYNDIIRDVSRDLNVIFCDIETVFGITKKGLFLDEDGRWTHLNEKGNELYAKAIYAFIEKAVEEVIE